MRKPIQEEIDYFHTDPSPDINYISECRWDNAVAINHPYENAYPLHIRREHYDRTLDIAHWHKDFYAVYIVRSGRGMHIINGQPHSMARGDVFIMAPDNTHSYRAPLDLMMDAVYIRRDLWPEPEWEALEEMSELKPFLLPGQTAFEERGYTDHFGHLSPEPHARIEAVLSEVRRELRFFSMPHHLSARARIYSMLVQLAEWRANKTFTTRPARGAAIGAAIAEVLSYCDQNFHRPLTTDQLAAMMHFSRANFFIVFTREVGMPPASYLRHLRLQNAQRLLREQKELPIADVARLSGFGDATQLGRTFKKAFGISPMAFRRSR